MKSIFKSLNTPNAPRQQTLQLLLRHPPPPPAPRPYQVPSNTPTTPPETQEPQHTLLIFLREDFRRLMLLYHMVHTYPTHGTLSFQTGIRCSSATGLSALNPPPGHPLLPHRMCTADIDVYELLTSREHLKTTRMEQSHLPGTRHWQSPHLKNQPITLTKTPSDCHIDHHPQLTQLLKHLTGGTHQNDPHPILAVFFEPPINTVWRQDHTHIEYLPHTNLLLARQLHTLADDIKPTHLPTMALCQPIQLVNALGEPTHLPITLSPPREHRENYSHHKRLYSEIKYLKYQLLE